MPLYTFKHPVTGETRDVFFHMNDQKKFMEDGVEWERVWLVPQASTDTHVDPFSIRKLVEKTNKPDSLGSLWDRAADASAERAKKNGGVDPIREKHLAKYSKERGGLPHPSLAPQKVVIDF